MTPLQEFEKLNNDKRVVNAQIREYIAALLTMKDRLNDDEQHLKDFIDLALLHYKNKIGSLNEAELQASRRLPKVPRL